MRASRLAAAALLAAGSSLACQQEAPLAIVAGAGAAGPSAVADFAQDAYPTDISPPPGLRYPCALEALPRDPVGIPAPDRAYINHTYTRILRATQAKLLVLDALFNDPPRIAAATARYQATTAELLARLGAEPPPAGLEAFRDDVVAAVTLQRELFAKAAPLRSAGKDMDAVFALAEGHAASARLQAAWGRMTARYPGWDAATKDSIYHHLCALDLF
ncbi:MAG TPA: hypothetical protein VGV61_10630 [Thermoanaerobaculia bacterium]|jgi:hypothetical protein|nr:hypothetical protein [Thermoanaerobaculia bacterium]